ncbi:MAG: MucBP domain-containing protein, partial [Lactococcus raffinolactis]
MKFKTGVALILSGTTLGLGARVMTIGVVADTQEEKAPTFSPTSVTSRTVTVSGDDFLNYFQRNGSAVHFNYDLTDHIQTLTPNQKHQSGNVTLKTKVDMSQDFTFNGLINLGNKSSRMGGADGVGFLFHPGNTDVVGRDGGAAGIGGVQGAFGFKLDTYYNANHETSFNPDPSEFASGQSYGAFVDGTTSVAQTLEDGAQPIAQPSYDIFKPFKMFYNGTSKIMTVTYDGQTWQQDVSSLIGNNSSMSFSISASTGENYNLQQLQITNFQYTVAQGTVVANYIDENQNQLKTPVTTNGDIDTIYSTNQASIPGYTFKEVMGAAPTGTYQANVQNINYVYTRKQGLATITYIDDTTGQALNQKEITGATGEEATYDLVSDTYPMTGVVYDQD